MKLSSLQFIKPNWPAPSNIHAISTVRIGGINQERSASFNLAKHVDDNPVSVDLNRTRLKEALELFNEPAWLQQVHGNKVIAAHDAELDAQADASYTHQPHVACAVLTADCLPILLTDQFGQQVAAIHAGWRGLAAGIIAAVVEKFTHPPNQLLAWLGPAISAKYYAVGAEVYAAFVNKDSQAQHAFTAIDDEKWLADLYLLARQCLNRLGVDKIFGGEFCTYSNQDLFFSHRREQGKTGRMATLIWKSVSSI